MKRIDKKGITLIELIIVMVIIAIGAIFIVPGISSWIPHYRLRTATRDIVSTMRIAQMKAISTNLTYQIFFDSAKRSFILQYQNTGGGIINDGDIQVLGKGIQMNTTLVGNIAMFRPDSTITDGSGNTLRTVNIINPKGSQETIILEGRRIKIKNK